MSRPCDAEAPAVAGRAPAWRRERAEGDGHDMPSPAVRARTPLGSHDHGQRLGTLKFPTPLVLPWLPGGPGAARHPSVAFRSGTRLFSPPIPDVVERSQMIQPSSCIA